MGYDDEGRKSVFNAGVAQTERIDSLQRAINMARFNLLAVNPETGTFNYEITIAAIDGLLEEGKPKFQDKEKDNADKIRKLVHSFVEIFPPIANSQQGWKISKDNYKKLTELLTFYESTIKEYLDAHNLNNPDSDDDEGL